MYQTEYLTHSFIIRIWLEESIAEAGVAKWRGSITNVQDGQRIYFEDLDAIKRFILPFLAEMGIDLPRS